MAGGGVSRKPPPGAECLIINDATPRHISGIADYKQTCGTADVGLHDAVALSRVSREAGLSVRATFDTVW